MVNAIAGYFAVSALLVTNVGVRSWTQSEYNFGPSNCVLI